VSVDARWLSLKEAARYAHLGRDRLKAAARSKLIRGFKDPDSKRGDWIFDRQSLDDYRNSQGGVTILDKVWMSCPA